MTLFDAQLQALEVPNWSTYPQHCGDTRAYAHLAAAVVVVAVVAAVAAALLLHAAAAAAAVVHESVHAGAAGGHLSCTLPQLRPVS
jgi:hypothetical protein